jgi:hypothetical protein
MGLASWRQKKKKIPSPPLPFGKIFFFKLERIIKFYSSYICDAHMSLFQSLWGKRVWKVMGREKEGGCLQREEMCGERGWEEKLRLEKGMYSE